MTIKQGGEGSFRFAWVTLVVALGVHVADEALTGFLDVYNPTAIAIRSKAAWLPIPLFTYREWLTGLIAVCCILLLLSLWADRRHRAMRVMGYIFAVIMVLNAAAHTTGTIVGHTFSGLRFARPMPGFYSSPVILAAAIYLFVALRRADVESPRSTENAS